MVHFARKTCHKIDELYDRLFTITPPEQDKDNSRVFLHQNGSISVNYDNKDVKSSIESHMELLATKKDR